MKQKIEYVAEKYTEMIWNNWCSKERIKNIIYQALTELLSNAEGEGWISVEERLPEGYSLVLIWDNDTVYVATFEDGVFNEHNLGWDGSSAVNSRVTHWMPLPKSPSQPTSKGERV